MNPFIFVVVAFWTHPEDGSLVMKQMKHFRDIGPCYKAAEIINNNMKGAEGLMQAQCLRSRKLEL